MDNLLPYAKATKTKDAKRMAGHEKDKLSSTLFRHINKRIVNDVRFTTCNSYSIRYSKLLIVVLLLIMQSYQACSLILDCDSVKNCICQREDDGGWRIECPNEVWQQYPIELKVQRFNVTNNEASLSIKCAPLNSKDSESPWSYIKGMDLSIQQVHAKITFLEVKYCPPVKDGWSNLLKQTNLNGAHIRRFSFITDGGDPLQIPPNFFDNMPNIENLNLRNNQLTSIPDLSSLHNLQTINLRYNSITSIPPGAFSKNTQLNGIALTTNRIRDIQPGTFPDSLEHLELNQNQISTLNASVFSNIRNLKRLFLNNNPLDNLDPDTFTKMLELEDLRLHNSKMREFPNFQELPKLVNLSISNAIRFINIPSGSGSPQGEMITTTLPPEYLPENKLELRNLPLLETITLQLNHFTTLPVLENLPKLKKIDLGRNDITEIENEAFSGLPALKVVNLSRNKIRKMGTIKAPSLNELDASNNNLTELQNHTFLYLSSLKKLNLAWNEIQTVAHKAFEPLSDLEELDMSHNQVTFSSSPYSGQGMHDELFGDFSNQSPLRYSLKLRKLRLSHNAIEKLGFSDWAQVFIQINEIDLSYNKIKRVTANELNFISSNLSVNLEGNEISVVDMRMSFLLDDNQSISKEIRVSLNGNPLQCDCLAYGLKTFSSESYDLRIKNLSCSGPPELQGKNLVEVSDANLVCEMEANKGCPEPCLCKERTVDKTVLIDCSSKNLTNEDIPPLDTFKGVYAKWTMELDLSDNEINDFNNVSYIRKFLNKTRHVNLSGNRLTSTLFLEKVGDFQPTTFSISDNPFPCSNCIGFQIPWRAFPTRISDLANVTCQKVSEDSKKFDLRYVQEIKDVGDFCAPKLAIFVIPLVVAVILLSCLCIALFVTIKYGWAIKAYLYSKGLDWCLFWESDMDEEDDDGNEKLYDAFVSYSHKDEEWVLDELVNRIEGMEGFKLCLHFRDWTPGDWIPDQIVRSVDKSRRTIVVLSKNFVESVWSRLEFKAAHAQALKERSNRVILILLGEDLKECDVQDDDLKMYMKMNTFMKWNDPLFWHRLKYALPHKKSTTPHENTQNIMNKMQQRERAIKLDKLRAKLEQNV